MLVDKILEYYGINPEAYPEIGDRWNVVFSEFLLSSYIYFPFIFALLPWLYFFLKKNQYAKNKRKFIKKIVIASIIGFLIGCMMPFLVFGIAASLAASALYGG